jgi:Kdo2-lipid IVA lauroyltransferase/acyltransferase
MRIELRRAVDYTVYGVVRLLVCIIQAMPIETAQSAAGFLAWLLADVFKVRGRVVDDNLVHAFPELTPADRRRLVRRMWEHLLVMVVEIAHAPRKIHDTNWRDYVRLHGEGPLLRLLLEDRPTLVTTAHFGNFEVAGYVLALLGFKSHTVARTLDNPYLDRFVNRFRGATGQYIIPKNGGYDQILDVLSDGGTMTFLADQYAGPKGCWVQFFGRPASAHKAIALLAMEHQAPVVVSYARRIGRPMHFELSTYAVADPRAGGEEFASVRALTQWYTSRLEEIIRRQPDQYWWLHRRWKDTRPPRPAARKAA